MLKVLFVCSGNKSEGPGSVVANQAQSLLNFGVNIQFYLIKGKGSSGYLKNVITLRKSLKKSNFDIIHAHGISALVASLSVKRPLIVSLLGSELNESKIINWIISLLAAYYWNHTIVKSHDMLQKLKTRRSNKISIIPNGVNLTYFKPLDKKAAKEALKWDTESKHVLWLADPDRKSKNYPLAVDAIKEISQNNIQLITIHSVKNNLVPYYLNAADTILLTSLWEGSPNIIKEAMACNRPIVSTNVGDIKWLFGEEPGHFVSTFESGDVAVKLEKALSFSKDHVQTNGRERIKELGLDSVQVAERLVTTYEKVIKR
jgi:glycosyltransferase involved in cell wall biosynthesis